MADTSKLVEQLSGLTVLEIAGLVKELETKWGVSAAAPVAVAAPGGGGGAAPAEAAEEKTEFTVVLTGDGGKKINVIKAVREVVPGLGLADAKKLVESAPATLKDGLSKAAAEEMKKKMEEAGATIELK